MHKYTGVGYFVQCGQLHRHAKPQRFSLQQLIILLTAGPSRGPESELCPILVNSSNMSAKLRQLELCRKYTLVDKNGGKTGASACTSTLGSVKL